MIRFDTEKDIMSFSGSSEDIQTELICIIKIIQQEFIRRKENESFISLILESLFDNELNDITKEFMKENKVKKGWF